MKRWLPSPWLSSAIFVGWLLLARSVTAGQLLLALLAAIAVPRLTRALRPTPRPLRRWGVLTLLILRVGRDVLRSSLQVARGVVRRPPPRGRHVVVPLELRDVHALAALAMITNVVPGTVWNELAPDRSRLLLHVYEVGDEAAFIAHYKAAYERPLKEIFE
ncbi:MAG: Na+/H+ antiporter subunit E [Burkholderiales bacterium]|nr:Na+/H+ antiporter subunit E [Burkholderiales bacterium]